MRSGVFKILTVRGIDIKVHWSWAIIALLVTYQLAAGYFPLLMPGESDVVYWGLGFVAAVALFLSVLLHELSHSFMAQALGMKVRDITLFIFGGVSNIEQEPETARHEFLVAVVGPLTSLVLAGVFFLLEQLAVPPVHRVGAGAAALLQYLALINLLLGLFNLIPGFPLDGGRVLRSIVWGITRNLQTATRVAGFIGQLVAYGFIFWGLYQTFFLDDFSGLWIAFIGWYLLSAAQQSVAGTVVRETLRRATVGQLMEPLPPIAPPHITIAQLLTQYLLAYNLRAVPVALDGRLVGIITLGDIQDVPQHEWGMVTVEQKMTGGDRLRTLRPQDDLGRAMTLLDDGHFDQLPVVDTAGRLVGVLNRAHLLRWLKIRDELLPAPPAK